MQAQLQEILPFLHDRNPDARQVALSYLVPHTPSEAATRSIFLSNIRKGTATEPEVIRDLKLLCRDRPDIAHDAFKALINLTDSVVLCELLSEPLFLNFLVAYILHPASVLADLACMLLSNLTASPRVATSLIPLEVDVIDTPGSEFAFYTPQSRSGTSPPPYPYPDSQVQKALALPLLIEAFANSATLEKHVGQRKGQLHFLASVFSNISTHPDGRRFFLSTHKPLTITQGEVEVFALAPLLPFTEHPDLIRRGGVASTIKNCAFLLEGHTAMLAKESDLVEVSPGNRASGLYVLPRILLPLAGPEDFEVDDMDLLLPELQFLPSTKVREKDPVLRTTHLESLLLFCTDRAGRDILRSSGVYEIIRMLHESEDNENVIDHIERLVNMLKRDEEGHVEEIKKDVEQNEDDTIEEI